MFPINKEFITPEELRAEADILERTADRYEAEAKVGAVFLPRLWQELREKAAGKRAAAKRLEAEACREDADFLETYRADVGITNTEDALASC